MKNSLLCLLSALLFTFVAVPAHAGFAVKKHTTVQSASATTSVSNMTSSERASAAAEEFVTTLSQKMQSPSGLFVRWAQNGTLGLFAFLFGILGFLAPFFAIPAVAFGFIGMKRFCSGRMMAVLGFTMGVVAIALVVFGAYAPFF